MNRLFKHANSLLCDNPLVIEEDIQKEHEIRIPLKSLPNLKGAILEQIEQAFIAKPNDDCDVRIRKSTMNGKTTYDMTAKFRPMDDECPTEITKECFDALWTTAFSKQTKTRHHWNGWEIDDIKDEGVVAEFEYKKKSDIPEIPKDWEVKEDKK